MNFNDGVGNQEKYHQSAEDASGPQAFFEALAPSLSLTCLRSFALSSRRYSSSQIQKLVSQNVTRFFA